MPELPEVETVARDLRAASSGATITGAALRLAAHDRVATTLEAFAEGVTGRTGRGGRPTGEARRRRAVGRLPPSPST